MVPAPASRTAGSHFFIPRASRGQIPPRALCRGRRRDELRSPAGRGCQRWRPRVVLDIGGGSTEVVYGHGPEITYRASFPIGAVNITERFLKGDPPTAAEFDAAERAIEQALSPLEPSDPDAAAIGTGGTLY